MAVSSLTRYELEKEILNPSSPCYIDNLLDVLSSLILDCDFPSARNSRPIQRFLEKFSKAYRVIEANRTKYSDFDVIKVIGQGGFGRVQLVRHKKNRRVYAMKMMSKEHLLAHSELGLWEERDIMVQSTSEWLVACHEAFMDQEQVYLCMEYMAGGDLYFWLEELGAFTEDQARFYLAETVLALEVLHGLGFVHRDLKPDNLLLDARGHLKLADFGSCVRMTEEGGFRCAHPTGTPDYISPEVLNCEARAALVGPECDWWALGVICYEMLFEEPAFYGQSLVQTYRRILSHATQLKFPDDPEAALAPDTEAFIRALLQDADKRLGAAKNGGVEGVKRHAFFRGIDWSNLRLLEAAIRPDVSSEIDTKYVSFDERDASNQGSNLKLAANSSADSGLGKLARIHGVAHPGAREKHQPAFFTGSNLFFAGFTYRRDARLLDDIGRCDTLSSLDSPSDLRQQLEEARQEARAARERLAQVEAVQRDRELLLQRQADNIDSLPTTDGQGDVEEAELDEGKAEEQLEARVVRAQLREVQAQREVLEERLAEREAEQRAQTEAQEAERRRLTEQLERWREAAEASHVQLADSHALCTEVTAKCSLLEQDVARLTTQIQAVTKERDLAQKMITSSVNKLVEFTKPGMQSGKRHGRLLGILGHHHNNNNVSSQENAALAADFQALEKRCKNLEGKLKEQTATSTKDVHALRHELAERMRYLAELSESYELCRQELAQAKAVNAQLCDRLEGGLTPDTNSTLIAPDSSGQSSQLSRSDSLLMPSQTALEAVVDFLGRPRGRRKIALVPKFAVLRPFSISFYHSREERDSGAAPFLELRLGHVLHARAANTCDVHHAAKEDIPRFLQILYDDKALMANQLDAEDAFLDDAASLNLSLSGTSSSDKSSGLAETIEWQGHSFQRMTYRLPTLCDVCHRPCSDLLNPPAALECLRCRLRAHASHVEEHRRFAACAKAEILLVRMASPDERRIWCGRIQNLRDQLKALTAEPGLAQGAPENLALAASSLHARSLYRSMRASQSLARTATPDRHQAPPPPPPCT